MKTSKFISKIFLVFILICLIGCKEKKDPNLEVMGLIRGDLALCGSGQFGEVNFLLSCGEDTQSEFNLAISLLHSFEYTEAEKAFVRVIDQDPSCAMAYWGIAMSNFHPLWYPPSKEELIKGSKILEIANELPQNTEVKEYLEAVSSFYNDWETVDHPTRIKRFEKAMEGIYLQHPDDKEAAIFYALALKASSDKADKTYSNERKAGVILEGLFPDQPEHPGIAHYIIHNYDNPVLAPMALGTARRYAEIAPASAHAQHMPSHIFTRLGLWDESVATNLNSTSSAVCYATAIQENAHWDEEVHGMGYLVYAYLQIGDNQKALEQYQYLKSFDKIFPANFKIAYTSAAIPSRIALENKDWLAAANLQLPLSSLLSWDSFPWERSNMNFARALGFIHLGEKEKAIGELEILKSNNRALKELGDDYKANQIQIQVVAISSWLKIMDGENERAISLMKEAVNMEESTSKHPVTPGELIPAEELLGDMLMQLGKTEEALVTYEQNLATHPNRFNGLYGAAMAAKEVGDFEKSTYYFKQLLLNTQESNSTRPELITAQNFLDTQKG
ncbi:MAG: hypothetical protein WBN11_09650 [Eudoraea sp.]|uniref:tetratricopeptide repeat protein n=1 Tax=Eudoraea sp. TaxID=1979955 RepID=UPI003C7188A4